MTCPVLMLMTRLSHVWPQLFPLSIIITLGIATIAARARYTTSIGGVCISNSQYLSLQALDAGFHILALILAFLGGVVCIFYYVLVDARSSPKRVSSQASGYRSISFFHLTPILSNSTFVYSPKTLSLNIHFYCMFITCPCSGEEFSYVSDWCTSYYFCDVFIDICDKDDIYP